MIKHKISSSSAVQIYDLSYIHLHHTHSTGLNFFQALISQLVCVTAMINHKILSFSAVQIYDLSYIHLHCAVFLNRTICSHSASLHPNAKKDMGKVILWGKPSGDLCQPCVGKRDLSYMAFAELVTNRVFIIFGFVVVAMRHFRVLGSERKFSSCTAKKRTAAVCPLQTTMSFVRYFHFLSGDFDIKEVLNSTYFFC